jgi:hypothetical protein
MPIRAARMQREFKIDGSCCNELLLAIISAFPSFEDCSSVPLNAKCPTASKAGF